MTRTRARVHVWTLSACSDIGSAADARGTSCCPLPGAMRTRSRPGAGRGWDEAFRRSRSPPSGAVVNARKDVFSNRRNQFGGFNWEAWLANKK